MGLFVSEDLMPTEQDFKWRIMGVMKHYRQLERLLPSWFSWSLLKCYLVDDTSKSVFLSYPEVMQHTAANGIAQFTPRAGNASAAPS